MTSLMTSVPARPQRTPRQERVERKRQLVAALQVFSRYGFDEGAGGHITARDPHDPDKFWINPFGINFAHVRMSDLLLVDGDPLANIKLSADPAKNFVVIMKDGKVFKNAIP